MFTGLGVMQHGERACHPTRSNGGRAGTAGRDAWDPDTGPLRETRALPYRRFMKDAAMCRNLAIRRHANVDIFGDHAAATVTPDAPPGRGDCFAKKYRLVAATCHNSYKTIQKTIRPPPWRDAVAGCRAGRAARKGGLFRQEISSCSGNVSQQLQNDTENNPAPAVAGCRAGRAARERGLFRQEISSCSCNVSQQLQDDTENNPTPAGGGASPYAADTSLSWPVAQS